MITITMSAKGQFVLPKSVRESLKLFPGTKVTVSVDDQGRLLLTPSLHEPQALFADRPPVRHIRSIDEMNRAVGKAVSGS